MSRRSILSLSKVAFPLLLTSFVLTGCGSGSNGSADTGGGGGSPVVEDGKVTVATTFDFEAPAGFFVVGEPPIHARFSGGEANDNGAWVIRSGQTAVIDFATPADTVQFVTKDNYTPPVAAFGGARKSGTVGAQAVTNAPFTTPMFLRGLKDDWATAPARRFRPDATTDNVLVLSLDLGPDVAADTFKIADEGWSAGTDCGKKDADAITIGAPYNLDCGGGLGKDILLTIPEQAKWKFTFDVRDAANPTLTVAKDVPTGGGGGEPEPENSTEVRIFGIDTLTAGATEKQLGDTITGIGNLTVEEIKERTGATERITRIEIENLGTAGDIGIEDFQWVADPQFRPEQTQNDLVYRRQTGTTVGTTIKIGTTTYTCEPIAGSTNACVVRDVPVYPFENQYMVVTNADGSTEEILFNSGRGGDIDDESPGEVVYAFSGSTIARNGIPGDVEIGTALPANAKELIVFYKREDNDYEGWTIHLFPIDPSGDSWTTYANSHPYEGIDPQWGAYFRISLPGSESPTYSNNPAPITDFPTALGGVIHRATSSGGDEKDPTNDLVFRIGDQGNMVFVTAGNPNVGSVPPNSGATFFGINGSIAHWVDRQTIVMATSELVTGEPAEPGTKVQLLFSPNASIRTGPTGITGTYQTVELTPTALPTAEQLPNQRHLTVAGNYEAYSLPTTAANNVKNMLRGQLVVRFQYADGSDFFGTNVQIPGVLDAVYAATAAAEPLGVTYSGGTPSLAVWAPTALKDPGVSVNIYDADGDKLATAPMTLDETTGIWKVTGESEWNLKFYTVSLRVFSYAVNALVTNEVTDPYSVSLSTDSVRSQFVDLNDPAYKPAGWDSMTLPALAAPEDMSIYELHVRDFSVADPLVPAAHRGKFTAFNEDVIGVQSHGLQHLQQLANAGLRAVHILPAFDIATVPENAADQVNLDDPVEELCAKNADAAELCSAFAGKTIRQAMQESVGQVQGDRPTVPQIQEWLRGYDAFNWGYDPLHFGAPEGSYSTDPNGPQRILEFRQMVQGLNGMGLRTILDVVYNHTNASGQGSKSVLDKVVPGYYHRRDPISGAVLRNSCCEDTAAEFRMMEKLMVDTGVTWVRDYKVSGFRFDIMSMHPLPAMERFKAAVEAVLPSVYIYGEGWNIESQIKDDAWFVQARQANLGGTGIGSFSDRIRDPIRGGGPFDGGAAHITNQGFISGQYYDPNSLNTGADSERLALLRGADNIRVWEAGGLASYSFVNYEGNTVTGAEVDYGGQESGYTQDPEEAINYISKHDNEALWDISQYKHPAGTPLADRVRADSVGMSMILLAQGVPFWQAGTEILRSKSMDRNSYDSGDWYNEIDWTLATSKWNQGLPLASDNAGNYPQIQQVSADPTAAQDQAARQRAFNVFKEFLRIRYSTNLFRMPTADDIEKRLSFLNTGTSQVPGVIAMKLEGCTEPGASFVPDSGGIVVIYNATDGARTLSVLADEAWALHPIQAASVDPVVKTATHDANGFTVPARTTAVFQKNSQSSCAPFGVPMFVRGFGDADWSANPEAELLFAGGTTYTRPITAPAGALEFKIADANWTAETNCGGAVDGVTLELAQPTQIACFSDSKNLRFTSPAAGDYTFTLDAANLANPILTISKPAPFGTTTMFLRGSITSWDATTPFTWDGLSHYRAEVNDVAAGSYAFKVADANWTGPTNCGAATGGTSATLGTPFALTCASSSQDIGLAIPQLGSYAFAVDGSNASALSVTVTQMPLPTLYVRGLNADWDANASTRMTYAGNSVYKWSNVLAAGADDFKIADADWTSGSDCGAGTPVTLGAPLTLTCASPGNSNIAFTAPAAGLYEFTLNATNPTAPQLTVTGP